MLERLGKEQGRSDVVAMGKKGNWFGALMLHPDRPSPTILKTSASTAAARLYHWKRREVTVPEALALTGFPADYILTGSHAERWARVGNSVAPPMTREIAIQSLAPLNQAR